MTESSAAGVTSQIDPLATPPAELPTLPPASLGELVPMSRFSAPERAQVAAIAKGIDWSDMGSIMAQMNAPNQRFADALTRQLSSVAVYETGAAAGLVLELSRQIKSANLSKMRRESRGKDWVAETFGNLPLVGAHVSAIRHFQLNHKQIVGELERIRNEAHNQVGRLRALHQQLDEQEKATETVLREMMVHIAACQMATQDARAEFERMRAETLSGDRDPFAIQKLRDFGEAIAIMETRLVNAKASFLDKMLAIPDIRARQTAARIEMSNAIDTIQNDIPDLASAIARLVAAYHIAQSQKSSELRRDNRRALAAANADALDDVLLTAKRSQAGALAEIDALGVRVDRLMKTLDESAKLDEQNSKTRAQSNAKLTELRDAIVTGLADTTTRALGSY